MKIIAMIPARLGSKRIPKKNLRYLDGKPLIQHAIDLANDICLFDEIWVNSESEELGRFVERKGIKFHKRPDYLADDNATNQQFTEEFLKVHDCDYVVMLNTTSPLLKLDTIKGFIQFLKKNSYDTVLSVIDEQAETFYKGEPLNFSFDKKVNSQDLIPISKVVWALTAWKKETFLKHCEQNECGVFSGNIGTYSIPKDEACDLDTIEDWAIAEGMFEARKKALIAKYWEEGK